MVWDFNLEDLDLHIIYLHVAKIENKIGYCNTEKKNYQLRDTCNIIQCFLWLVMGSVVMSNSVSAPGISWTLPNK